MTRDGDHARFLAGGGIPRANADRCARMPAEGTTRPRLAGADVVGTTATSTSDAR